MKATLARYVGILSLVALLSPLGFAEAAAVSSMSRTADSRVTLNTLFAQVRPNPPSPPPIPCPPTTAPVPGGPSGRINNPRPTFSWSAVRGATSYTLYVLRVSDDAVIVRQTGITGTSFTPSSPLPIGVDLRYKVKAESPCGPGPYSSSVAFRVDRQRPGPPPRPPR